MGAIWNSDFTTTIGCYGTFYSNLRTEWIFKIGLGPAVGCSESVELYLCGEYRVGDAEEPNCAQKMFVDKHSLRAISCFCFLDKSLSEFTESSIFTSNLH